MILFFSDITFKRQMKNYLKMISNERIIEKSAAQQQQKIGNKKKYYQCNKVHKGEEIIKIALLDIYSCIYFSLSRYKLFPAFYYVSQLNAFYNVF
jgi:hypothetical protein